MNILQCIAYGLICGGGYLLPISSRAHQSLLQSFFGFEAQDPVLNLILHLSVLGALLLGCYPTIARIRRDRRVTARMRKSRARQTSAQSIYDIRLLTTACFPLLALLLAAPAFESWAKNPVLLCLFLTVNGVLLYVPGHIRQGNKDARSMAGLDGILIGTAGALSVFPGVSLTGMAFSASVARGAEKRQSMTWALLLGIPAMALFACFDAIALASGGAPAMGFFSYLTVAVTAFSGAYLSIVLLQYITFRSDLSGFSYYCWGAALLQFFLYLIV